MYVDPGSLNDFMGKYSFKVPSAILMGAGSIVMLTGFCGCLGAIKESRCLLGSFFFMLLIIFCAEIACGILGFLFRNKIDTEIKKESETVIKTKYGTGNFDLDHAVDTTQRKFKCCGANGETDYSGSMWESSGSGSHIGRVPQSCCKEGSSFCSQKAILMGIGQTYTKGCAEEIKKYAMDHMLIIGGIAIGVGAIQILGMIFALCLFFSIDKM